MRLFFFFCILLIGSTSGQTIGGIICALFPCPSGTRCEAENLIRRCVPVPTTTTRTTTRPTTTRPTTTRPTTRPTPRPPSCSNVFCFTRGGCGLVYPAWCPPGCQPRPQCLEYNNCRNHWCPPNQECILVQATCVRPPCYPIAQCRPRRIIWPWLWPISQREGFGVEGPSCEDERCTAPAECAFIKPLNCGVETNYCTLKPACIKQNPCAVADCKESTQCVLYETKGNPVAKCEPTPEDLIPEVNSEGAPAARGSPSEEKCMENEIYLDCVTNCSDIECNQEPKMCTEECVGSGCVCQEGFFRDKTGNCVTENECDLVKGVEQP